MSDMIKRDDVLRIIDGRFSRMMIGDILKQDINALPATEAIYICDRKKCEDCNTLCDFTRDINHAGTINKALIIDKKKEDIKLASKGRKCRIDRCELFNRLATITAEDANEMKAQIYAVIQEMDPLPAARRGSWEVRPAPEEDRVLGRWRYYCSACGGWTSYGRSDFCPRCGAMMAKGESDE